MALDCRQRGQGLRFENTIETDCAPLAAPVLALLAVGVEVHCLRDLTRGGLATTLIEIAESSRLHYAVWGPWPAGHHLTSVALHGFDAGLVVLLFCALSGARSNGRPARRSTLVAAVATGLCWGLHPLRVESVAWISERKDPLCALFYLLGLLAYLRHASSSQRRWYVAAIACLALALLSKPMAVSFPLVLLVLDAYLLERLRRPTLRRALVEKIPFVLLAAASALVTLHAQRSGGAMKALDGVPLSTRAMVAIQSTVGYLGKTLFPADLHALYSYPQDVSLGSWQVALPLLALLLLVAAGLSLLRLRSVFPAALSSYLAMLLPVIGIVQVGPQAMADRYTYLPGIVLALLVGTAFDALWARTPRPSRRFLAASMIAFLVGLAVLSIRQIPVWHDSESLWGHVLAYEPGNTEAHNSRADDYYQRGRFHDALADYTAALASIPAVGPTHALKRRAAFFNDRAVTLVRLGRLAEAVADESEAIRLQPARPDYHLNRARMHRLMGRPDDAKADLQRAQALHSREEKRPSR
jgi:tetratricopeptide (TPR) repeat protein